MKVNVGYFINKFIILLYRPALRNCKKASTAKIGSGSNCIDLTIGKYSYIGRNNSVSNVVIGNYCSIASNCSIGGGKHPIDMVSTSPFLYSKKNIVDTCKSKTVYIGNDVWIGEKVFIKDGINIGNGAIIGAHSVVTHDVEPYSIVVGNPAKLLKYRFEKSVIDELEKTKWWDKDLKELQKYSNYFIDTKKFVEEYNK